MGENRKDRNKSDCRSLGSILLCELIARAKYTWRCRTFEVKICIRTSSPWRSIRILFRTMPRYLANHTATARRCVGASVSSLIRLLVRSFACLFATEHTRHRRGPGGVFLLLLFCSTARTCLTSHRKRGTTHWSSVSACPRSLNMLAYTDLRTATTHASVLAASPLTAPLTAARTAVLPASPERGGRGKRGRQQHKTVTKT